MKDEKNYKKIRQLIQESGLIKGAYSDLIISGIADYLNNHGVTVQEGVIK